MQQLNYRRKELFFEDVSLQSLADEFDTPLYVYSETALVENFKRIDGAFGQTPHLICYALKANSNPAVLNRLKNLGAGADVVSGGELKLALQAGISPNKIVFAGVGKRDEEIIAAIETGVLGLNVESEMELQIIAELAKKLNKTAPISLRLNPDIDIHGHPYISTGRNQDKFGISLKHAAQLLESIRSDNALQLVGIHSHIGSQISELNTYRKIAKALGEFAKTASSACGPLRYIDVGGGLGVNYENPIAIEENVRGVDHFALPPEEIVRVLVDGLSCPETTIVFEPGRSLIAAAGLLLTRVLFTKDLGDKRFVVVDAGMNDLLRPSLYSAYHEIVPVKIGSNERAVADIVGPICESGDFLAQNRSMPIVQRNDLLAVLTAGAYGFTLASNYNARPLPAEIMVSGKEASLVRSRQKSVWAG